MSLSTPTRHRRMKNGRPKLHPSGPSPLGEHRQQRSGTCATTAAAESPSPMATWKSTPVG